MTHAVYPSLAGKTVVITGGGSGIGEVMVEGFVRQKSKVFFLDVAENESNALVTRLADGVKFVKCDVTSVPGLRAALADIEAKAGPVSVLVNNAANDDRHKIEEVTPEYWENRIAVNLRHLFFAAQAVAPGMKKGGFIVGGSYGKGAVSCRGAGKKGWGAPAMLEMGGGSVGLQLGASSTDVIMLIMNREGMDSLLKDKFTLGGDASIAAGPVGRAATAETDALMKAKILSYSRSNGVFAGVALKGSTLKQDDGANKDLYGKAMDATAILNGKTPAPAGATAMIQPLMKYSPAGK